MHFVLMIESFIHLLIQQTFSILLLLPGIMCFFIIDYAYSLLLFTFFSLQLGFTKFFCMNTCSKSTYINSREIDTFKVSIYSFWWFENLH